MDGAELRKRRLGRGLTQDQVANAIESQRVRPRPSTGARLHRREQGEREWTISQAMISLMERGREPIPRSPRHSIQGDELPSLHDVLEELLALPDDALRERVGSSERGPYR